MYIHTYIMLKYNFYFIYDNKKIKKGKLAES